MSKTSVRNPNIKKEKSEIFSGFYFFEKIVENSINICYIIVENSIN